MANYFLILELPYNPAEDRESVISNRIEEKKRFWTQNINNYQKSVMYRHYIQLIPDIKRIMLDKSLRDEEARKAIQYVYHRIDPYFKIMAVSKIFCEEEIKLIEVQSHLSRNIIEQYMGYYGISLGAKSLPPENLRLAYKNMTMQTSFYWNEIYEKEYKKKPSLIEEYQLIEEKLKIFEVKDYYEFLEIPKNERFRYQPFMLCDQARKIAKERFKKNDMESAAGRQICSACCVSFENTQNKQKYDQYIEWKEKKELLDFVRELAKLKEHILLENQCNYIVKQLEKIVGTSERARHIFSAFCEVEKIMYSFPVSNEEKKTSSSTVYDSIKREQNGENYNTEQKPDEIIENTKKKKKSKIKIFIGIILAIFAVRILYIILLSVPENENFDSEETFNAETKNEIEEANIDDTIDETEEDMYKEEEEYEDEIEEEYEEEEEYEDEIEEEYEEEEEYEDEIEYGYEEEYIFVDSDSRKLTMNELDGLGRKELRIARNEIYARHGRIFESQDLQDYFDSCSWYYGEYEADEFKESWLSKKEKYNVNLILRYEKEMGYQ